MDIRINNITNFKSKAYPIKPFIIRTKRGKLNVSEVTQKDLKRDGFLICLTKFFCKNFAMNTKDPNWKAIKYKNFYEDAIKENSEYYSAKLKQNNDDTTLLIVKDKHNKIQGACLSYGYDSFLGAKDYVCFIDSIAVNPAFRGFDIGKILIEKTIASAKNKFTDLFLTGDRNAYKFYEKLGFRPLSKEVKEQKEIIEYLAKRRSDYPKYVEFFNKPIQATKERWYNKISIND